MGTDALAYVTAGLEDSIDVEPETPVVTITVAFSAV